MCALERTNYTSGFIGMQEGPDDSGIFSFVLEPGALHEINNYRRDITVRQVQISTGLTVNSLLCKSYWPIAAGNYY